MLVYDCQHRQGVNSAKLVKNNFLFFLFFCLGRSKILKKQKKQIKQKKQKNTLSLPQNQCNIPLTLIQFVKLILFIQN